MRTIKTTLIILAMPIFSWADQSVNAKSFISNMNKLVKIDRAVYFGQAAGKACKVEVLTGANQVTFLGEVDGALKAFVNVTTKTTVDRANFGDKLVVGNFSRFDHATRKQFNDSIIISKDSDDIKMVRIQMTEAGPEQQVTCWMDQ